MPKLTGAGAALLNETDEDQPTVFAKKTQRGFEIAFSRPEKWTRDDIDRLRPNMIRQMRVDRLALIRADQERKKSLEAATPAILEPGQKIINDLVVAK